MNNKIILKTALIFSIIGVLFSGYLTISKIVLGVCPLKESCPFLFNYPVCLYGLILFTTLLLAIITLTYIDANDKLANKILKYTAIFGILFSWYNIASSLKYFYNLSYNNDYPCNASVLLQKPLLEGRVPPRPLYGRRGSRPSK